MLKLVSKFFDQFQISSTFSYHSFCKEILRYNWGAVEILEPNFYTGSSTNTTPLEYQF